MPAGNRAQRPIARHARTARRPGGFSMNTTAALARPLIAAVSTALLLTLPEAAAAAQAERCPGSLDVPSSAAELGGAADAVVCLVNAERSSRGLEPLRRDGALAEAARKHAGDMA